MLSIFVPCTVPYSVLNVFRPTPPIPLFLKLKRYVLG